MARLVHITGLDELKARLQSLPKEITQKALRRGVAAGARVVKNSAIALAPVGKTRKGHVAGTLKRAAMIKFLPSESNDTQVEYIVTFRQGKRQQKRGRDAYYARFVEFGHKIVPRSAKATDLRGLLRNKRTLRARRGAATGFVPPHRFLGPAFDKTQNEALQAMIAGIEKGIDEIVR